MESKTKAEIKKAFQCHDKDSGSPGVQVALLCYRIDRLTEHLKSNKHDHNSRYGLIRMVSSRRKLLDYLARTDQERYKDTIQRLKLRR